MRPILKFGRHRFLLDGRTFTGASYARYQNGTFQHLAFFLAREKVGTERQWYDNGGPLAVSPQADGRPDGAWRQSYRDGNVKSLRLYVDGVTDQEDWAWHPNGQVSDFNFYDKGHEITYKSWIAPSLTEER